ncbi:Cysteine desulfurase [Deinococcus proteolyticus MRP]|uniref:Cysteine desulfurase n=1 Tax=Deinococcus proteolyticus (strain ATCC 35074 / DSM 20540 / JCM 6276 / NBRC 101906 / NCIMB 13154 / VKM Ac-1939 / CCM 2703 / MRP) TaxID=693977 RepID=F0RLA2_DEIPM|nr:MULTISPECIES: cysteine desulfurase family protein [Deinococcus]ADY25806.1 Cysteine desulfurase [Deinococcus proteolyticus MRP]MCY1701929.1 cysteine desulfurase family protein [Deinococcus sp. SL84]
MIYLDYAATHPMTPAALAAYAEAAALPGNPSSVHVAGQQARERLEEGRTLLAQAFGVDPRRLTLNSGGTEGDNAVLFGVAQAWEAQHGRSGHLITSASEHSAVLAPARVLAERGWDVTFLTPDSRGHISPEQLREALRPDTALVSLHHANNEIGTVQPTAELAALAAAAGVTYHTDAVQAPGVLPVPLEEWGVTYATFSAHKWGGPRGVGVLYSARGHDLPPQQIGGGQEAGQRAGTQNTAGIYAAGVALREAEAARAATFAHLTDMRRAFVEAVGDLPGLSWNHPADGSPKVASLTLSGADGEALLMNLDMAGVCASAGSACSAGTMQASHVLTAIGLSEADARSSLRFSFGAATTLEEVQQAAAALRQAAEWSRLG